VPDAGHLRRGEVALTGADGSARTLGVSISPFVDAQNRPLGRIINFQDLTDLRQMEDAVARSRRLAAIGRLAAGVAHEIRNPLAAISGSIELLASSSAREQPAEVRELTAIVLRETERLNGLVSELLDFARPHPPEPQPLELAASMAELLRVFHNDKELRGARVELRARELVEVSADPGQLRQVVWNLLRNAAEAAYDDEPIIVEVGRVSVDDAPRWGRITVRDHGPGIPAEHLSRVFEPFFSTKEGGTGLGLATVHRIVEEHHGRVEVDTPPDGGTVVTVLLPLHPAEATAPA
jgi:two-component system sensor histidine kinase PilS (NtrC family)